LAHPLQEIKDLITRQLLPPNSCAEQGDMDVSISDVMPQDFALTDLRSEADGFNVIELSVLLTNDQITALEAIAQRRKMTIAQCLRRIVTKAIHAEALSKE